MLTQYFPGFCILQENFSRIVDNEVHKFIESLFSLIKRESTILRQKPYLQWYALQCASQHYRITRQRLLCPVYTNQLISRVRRRGMIIQTCCKFLKMTFYGAHVSAEIRRRIQTYDGLDHHALLAARHFDLNLRAGITQRKKGNRRERINHRY